MIEKGILDLVSTPLGHLGDITARALDVLNAVDRIAAEDTRHTAGLLRHFSIQTPCFSCHDHNELERVEQMIGYLSRGESIALVSDAGTPLISDPGFKLVRALVAEGFKVVPVPGACAITTALVASGLPSDRFGFYGFPPAKQSARLKWYDDLKAKTGTYIFYESKHRLMNSLEDLMNVFGDVDACVGRELTKEYESFYRGSLSEVIQQLSDLPSLLGEFVVLVSFNESEEEADNVFDESISLSVKELCDLLASPPKKKSLAAFLAERTGHSKQDWYKSLLTLEDA
ncbi:MAG TPA: 16S rRNA (cytidine(1402)-2'-O)-methyltransferase [Gammaproteobacteria bacterium]|nr:16S rRNA (cytidine(1402)-2'-O)-methyltransferase [Gammaproteobacteria bacterium]